MKRKKKKKKPRKENAFKIEIIESNLFTYKKLFLARNLKYKTFLVLRKLNQLKKKRKKKQLTLQSLCTQWADALRVEKSRLLCLSERSSMVCAPVRRDNPRILARDYRRTGTQTMLYLTCTMMSSVDLASC